MVKQGYKQTEIGLIPNDWNIVSIEKLATDMSDGPFGSNLKKEHYTDDKQARIIQLSNIGENGWLDTNVKYTTFSHAKTISRCIVNPGHIIVAKMMPAGRAIICPSMEKMYVLGSDSIKLELNATLVNTKYFMYSTKSSFFQTQIKEETQGSTRARTSISKLRKNKVLLPSIEEQNRIAEALSDADSMISSLEKLITKKKAVKQGAMQDLLTCKKRLPGFTGEWKGYTIGKMGEFYSGLSGKSKKDFDCGEAYYITFLNVLSNVKIDTSILASVDVRENESQKAVRKGDLFFNTSSETPEEVGMCAVLNEELENTYLNSFCFGFRLFDDTHDPLFLSYYLNSAIGRKIMSVLAQGATRYNLSKNNFAETVIKLPVKEEQTAIASILSDMDNEIETLEQKLTKARQIKQGIMQQLLTGKIRLV